MINKTLTSGICGYFVSILIGGYSVIAEDPTAMSVSLVIKTISIALTAVGYLETRKWFKPYGRKKD